MNKKLTEDHFVNESYSKDPWPMWIFAAVILLTVGAFVGLRLWQEEALDRPYREQPFLRVTNRELSLFLWSHPEYMRSHADQKSAYLPGFHSTGLSTIKEDKEDVYVVVPPEVLFRYHLWKRILGDVVFARTVDSQDFQQFLQEVPEWSAERWRDYGEQPPQEVMQAYVGWRNYVFEGDAINAQRVTYGELMAFVEEYPEFAPNLWRNLYPKYLKAVREGTYNPADEVPGEEFPGFLRVAYFNAQVSVAMGTR